MLLAVRGYLVTSIKRSGHGSRCAHIQVDTPTCYVTKAQGRADFWLVMANHTWRHNITPSNGTVPALIYLHFNNVSTELA